MAIITVAQLAAIAGGSPDVSNMESVAKSLNAYGGRVGLDKPHRLAHFLAQLGHESGRFRYDRELWGPTKAQKGYEGRDDLGNDQPGDGAKFAGRGPIQLTGRDNVTRFEAWCTDEGMNPPDFSEHPDLINTDPWEGLSAIWFWNRGNQTGKSLNVYADANDIEQITKKINGGLNGFEDRIELYTRSALVLLGYGAAEVSAFQTWAQARGLLPQDEPGKPPQVDGDAGPKTRSALHMALAETAPGKVPDAVKAAPVTEEKEVAVAPAGADKTLWSRLLGVIALLGTPFTWFGGLDTTGKIIVGVVVVGATAFLLFRAEQIASRVKAVIKAFEGVGR